MKTKIILVAFVSLLVGILAGYGLTHRNTNIPKALAVGDTNSTSKIAQISLNLATSTPGSMYNDSGKDRIISSVEYYLAGLGTFGSNVPSAISALSWQMSTSTDVYLAASSNYLLNTTVATTSSPLYNATSTPGSTASAFVRLWAAGTYLNLFQNATSSPATGTLVVRYFVAP